MGLHHMTEKLVQYSKPKEFADAVVPFLQRDEARYSVLLGVIDTLVRRPEVFQDHYLAAFRDVSDNVTGAVWMTPPYAFGMTDLEESQIKLAINFAKTIGTRPTAIFGTAPTAEAFMHLWTLETGQSVTARMAMRMFEATEVIEPGTVAGSWRPANMSDLPILTEWTYLYSMDVHEPLSKDQAKVSTEQAISSVTRFIWEIDGMPMAMAGCIATSSTSSRVPLVFTPKDFRGRGYASNLVARLTQAQLNKKMRVFLYTDLANPTSNKIYQEIGYRPLYDSLRYSF